MTTTDPRHYGLVVEIEREYPTTAADVFRHWTEAEMLGRWFAPPGYRTVSATADARPGGAWRLDFRSDTHEYTEHGVYREVTPCTQLSLTLTQIDGDHTNPETLVTVDLEELGTDDAPRTRMRFTQRGYESRTLRDDNAQGWAACFNSLADALSAPLLAPRGTD